MAHLEPGHHGRAEHYYPQMQRVTSTCYKGYAYSAAPEPDYIMVLSLQEGRQPTVASHHYVAEPKRPDFQHGWRVVSGQFPPSSRA